MDLKHLPEMQRRTLLQLKNDLEKMFQEVERTDTDLDRMLRREKTVIAELEKLSSVTDSTKGVVEQMLRREVAALSELQDMHKRVHAMANLYYALHEELLSVIDPAIEDSPESAT